MEHDSKLREEPRPENLESSEPEETSEWLESLEGLLATVGPKGTELLLKRVLDRAHYHGMSL
ncbi:MAG: hypothetical protein IH935_06375, partial [Acidobacteria bacterium]|nr:hypothetical protein [Acidobacteriota bacterium]